METELLPAEATHEPEAAAGAESAETPASAAPTPDASDGTEAAPTTAPEQGDIRETDEFRQAVQAETEAANETYRRQLAEALVGARAPEDAPPEYDPFDPESVDQYVDWKLAQRTAPLEAIVEQFQIQQGTQQLHELFNEVAGEYGWNELKPEERSERIDTLATVARGILPALTNQDVGQNDPGEVAFRRAAALIGGYGKAEREQGVSAYRSSLGEVSSQPAEPGVGGAATQIEQSPKGYDAIIARYAARAEES